MTNPDRSNLRQRLIAAREALDAETRRALTSRIERHLLPLIEHLKPTTLGFCWPYRAEPDLTPLIAHWMTGGSHRRAALPVVTGKDAPLQFREWQPLSTMVVDRYGILIPAWGQLLDPAVLLVPVNGFDARGYRIGYGGGHFDRTLAVLRPAPITIGIGFEVGRLESIDPQPHDMPLDWIVTETGLVVAPPEQP